ncbi:hypothetical protein PSCICN_38400 [Pseudomonas cichorii]|nr:hypothetical protein PSCICN_38400 [Pseudomonas cichorii]
MEIYPDEFMLVRMTYHHAAMNIDHRVPYMEVFGPPASAQPRYMTGGKPAAGCVGRRFE